MTVSAFVPPQLAKEVRALLPAWAACMFAMGVSAVINDSRLMVLGCLAYGLGSIALGAQAIGHEYSGRTLGVLLAQPSDRRRILLLKFAVLASMLATLTLLAWAVFVRQEEIVRPNIWAAASTVLLAAPLGLFVAPFLTMLCRGPLAGMVFTVAAPGLLLIAGDLIGLQRYGVGGGALIDEFKVRVLWWGTLASSAIGAFASWRMFMRLEAIDGRGADLALPDWLRLGGHAEETQPATAVRTRHPAWLLVKKELHLQQMTFAVAGLYILSWTGVSLLRASVPDFPEIPLASLSVLYCVLLAGLVGSLASAEERQLGTIEWQMLLPMPAWQQW
ncbi:MAG: ABC transporter permease subunit, partial [Longimicrobiales bacterium]